MTRITPLPSLFLSASSILLFIFLSAFSDEKEALLRNRKALLLRIEQIIKESKECEEKINKEREEALSKKKKALNGREEVFTLDLIGVMSAKEFEEEFNRKKIECGKQYLNKLEPLQKELALNTSRIQALGGIDNSPSNTVKDSDVPANFSELQSIDFKGGALTPIEGGKNTNTDSKSIKCKNLVKLRDVDLPMIYKSTVELYQINHEMKSKFTKMRIEIEADRWKFSEPAKMVYILENLTVVTADLMIHLAAFDKNPFFKELATFYDYLRKKLDNGEDITNDVDNKILEIVCSKIVTNEKIPSGMAQKQMCDIIKDIQSVSKPFINGTYRFVTIDRDVNQTRALLADQILVLQAEIEKYNNALEREKNNLSNINELQTTLTEYLNKNCGSN